MKNAKINVAQTHEPPDQQTVRAISVSAAATIKRIFIFLFFVIKKSSKSIGAERT